MHLHLILFLAWTATTSCTFLIPRDLSDGFYTVDFPMVNETHSNYSHPIVKRHFHADGDDELGNDLSEELSDVIDDTHQMAARAENDNNNDDDYGGPVLLDEEDLPPPERDNGTYRGHENPTIEVTDFQCMYDQRPLPAKELDEAHRGLFKFCETYLVRKRTIQIALSKKGNVMSYVCNYRKSRAAVCGRREIKRVEKHYLDTHCGELVPGWVGMDSQGKKYGRAYIWDKICPYRKQKLDKTFWQGGRQ